MITIRNGANHTMHLLSEEKSLPQKYQIPLFVETTGGALQEETIETHREIADAIAAHEPLRAQDAMYLHLVYNRKRIQMIKKGDLI